MFLALLIPPVRLLLLLLPLPLLRLQNLLSFMSSVTIHILPSVPFLTLPGSSLCAQKPKPLGLGSLPVKWQDILGLLLRCYAEALIFIGKIRGLHNINSYVYF